MCISALSIKPITYIISLGEGAESDPKKLTTFTFHNPNPVAVAKNMQKIQKKTKAHKQNFQMNLLV
jgi:hypothetical protein